MLSLPLSSEVYLFTRWAKQVKSPVIPSQMYTGGRELESRRHSTISGFIIALVSLSLLAAGVVLPTAAVPDSQPDVPTNALCL